MAIYKVDIGDDNKFEPWSKDFWLKILAMTIAICIVCWIWHGDGVNESRPYINGPLSAVVLALVLSILNSFIKPVLSLFSLPMVISTFGLFRLVINAIIVMLAAWLMGTNFDINGFFNAFIFSIIVSVLSFLLDLPRRMKKVSDLLSSKHDPYRENNPNRNEATFTEYEDVTDVTDEDEQK